MAHLPEISNFSQIWGENALFFVQINADILECNGKLYIHF